jgi:mannosyltransferase OCH1-like enzyme
LLADESGVTYVDQELITLPGSREPENAYTVRQTGHGDTLDRVWHAVLKAERRAAAAQKEAAAWQAKYEQVARTKPAETSSQAVRTRRRATAAGNQPNRVRMPRIFHQIWLGPNPLPKAFAAYQQSWLRLRHHPDWELRLWTEDNLPKPLRRPEAAERLRIPAERANILRLEVVWCFGGVYVDTDLECLRSIEPLIEDADFFTVLRGSGVADNYFFGAVPGHPILDRGLDEIKPRKSYGDSKERTGPPFLNALIADHRDEIQLLDTTTSKRYATHHRHQPRSDPESVRLDILKARLEILEATHAGKDERFLDGRPKLGVEAQDDRVVGDGRRRNEQGSRPSRNEHVLRKGVDSRTGAASVGDDQVQLYEACCIEAVVVADLEDPPGAVLRAQLARLHDHLSAGRSEHTLELRLADRPGASALAPHAHKQGDVPGARLECVVLDRGRLEAGVSNAALGCTLGCPPHAGRGDIQAVETLHEPCDLERDRTLGAADVQHVIRRPKIGDSSDGQRASRRPDPTRTPVDSPLLFRHGEAR